MEERKKKQEIANPPKVNRKEYNFYFNNLKRADPNGVCKKTKQEIRSGNKKYQFYHDQFENEIDEAKAAIADRICQNQETEYG